MNQLNYSPDNILSAPVNLVLVLSGPSGVGKDATLSALKTRSTSPVHIITNTTRSQRLGETDGEHYHFISQPEFTRMISNNELLEHAEVYGNYYGVPKAAVHQALAHGKDVIIKVDVQGAITIKKNLPDAVLIFLMPPSLDELSRRLRKRGTESSSDLELRLNTARSEIEQLSSFDYVVVSHSNRIESTTDDISAIIAAEKLRIPSRSYNL
ncbi:MAG: guanylate kinase [Dehalococcoidia bacterium]|nr:guanylate kinase [Dehalococcoidia bacterium]